MANNTGAPLTRPLTGVTISITAKQNILAQIQAIGGVYANVASSARSWNIQLDPASTCGLCLLGDENVALSPQQCFLNMGLNFTMLDRASMPGMCPIGSVYAVPDAGTAILNIAVFGD